MADNPVVDDTAVHHLPVSSVLSAFNVDPRIGLSDEQVLAHREKYGSNALPVEDLRPWWKILLANILNPITAILMVCFTICVVFREPIDASCLMGIIVLNTTIGFISEMKSKSALDALRGMSKVLVTVIRNKALVAIPIDDLVCGDILSFKQGDVVGADCRVIEPTEADETLLTGESESQVKTPDAIPLSKAIVPESKSKLLKHDEHHHHHTHTPPVVPISERKNMCFRQTSIVTNSGSAVVTSTGYETQVGQLSKSLQQSVDESSDFEKRVNKLLFTIFGISLVLVVVIIGLNDWKIDGPILLYSSATSIALLPESCLLLSTLICALALRRLSQRNAIVRKLNVLSTLGTVDVLCSDKTGTLTVGRMCAKHIYPYAQPNKLDRSDVVESELIDIGGSTYGIEQAFYTHLPPDPRFTDHLSHEAEHFEEERRIPLTQVQKTCHYVGMVSALCNQTMLQVDDGVQVNPRTGEQFKTVTGTGNMTEIALAVLSAKLGRDVEHFEQEGFSRCGIFPFDSAAKLMSVGVRRELPAPNAYGQSFEAWVCTKGAPEIVLARCANVGDNYKTIMAQSDELATCGYRVLALAVKNIVATEAPSVVPTQGTTENGVDFIQPVFEPVLLENVEGRRLQDYSRVVVENNLTFIGLVAIIDPPKDSSFVTIEQCKKASIKTMMLTGDNEKTAATISRRLGILTPEMSDDDYVITGPTFDQLTDAELDELPVLPAVIARCSPYSKLKMVQALQRRGHVVAMTGDATNDILSLKAADVGACMGMNGTELAKSASDIVITDDNISTLVNVGIKEGRHIQQSVKKFVLHLLTGNSSEVTVLLFGLFFKDANGHAVFPLSPLEILSVNMITSSLIAVALSLEDVDPDIMDSRPETQNFLSWEVCIDTLIYGGTVSALSFLSYIAVIFWFGNNLLEGFPVSFNCNAQGAYDTCSLIWRARTTTYCVMTSCLLWHGYVCRHSRKSIFQMNFVSNKMMFGSVIGGSLLLLPAIYIPWVRDNLFKTGRITWEWWIVAGCTIFHLVLSEIYKCCKRFAISTYKSRKLAQSVSGTDKSQQVQLADLSNFGPNSSPTSPRVLTSTKAGKYEQFDTDTPSASNVSDEVYDNDTAPTTPMAAALGGSVEKQYP